MQKTIGVVCFLIIIPFLFLVKAKAQLPTQQQMQQVYAEIKTPYKYGIVIPQPDSGKMADSPTIFRIKNKWYMTYIIFNGTGYETWLAKSNNLLHWKTMGKTMPFTQNTWDANQKAGYVALTDINWGATYAPAEYKNNYWLSYLGGSSKGYEAGRLGVGMAYTGCLHCASAYKRLTQPVLTSSDTNSRWYDNKTIFKSTVIRDSTLKTGYPFVMYYNAAGDSTDANGNSFESIAMAVSADMEHWQRYGQVPVITKYRGICGDAQVTKMDSLYTMFYFGHNWSNNEPGAFEHFACSYDLVHWQEWNGPHLIEPTEDYDKTYAHKPCVIKFKGIVYHFYNAVGNKGRVIALATSKKLK